MPNAFFIELVSDHRSHRRTLTIHRWQLHSSFNKLKQSYMPLQHFFFTPFSFCSWLKKKKEKKVMASVGHRKKFPFHLCCKFFVSIAITGFRT